MLSFTIKDMESNYETIREFCAKYRKEITIYGGVLGEFNESVNCDEYIEFMNSLSFDVFVGSYLGGLLTNLCDVWCKPILKGDKTFEDMVESCSLYYGDKILKNYHEKMEAHS